MPIAGAAMDGEAFSRSVLPTGVMAEVPPVGRLTTPDVYKERLLVVDINRQHLDKAVLVLEDEAGMLYLWQQDVQRWRLSPLAGFAPIEYRNERYFPLSAFSDVSHVFDKAALTLGIQLRPQAFLRSTLTTRYDAVPPPVRSGRGGFINYDVLVARAAYGLQRSGLFEAGYFNAHGVGTHNFLANRLTGNLQLTRLDSTWTADSPASMHTLRLGDAINVPGSWGRAVRFGGIQLGTNFATQPGYTTYPPQSVAGQAVIPSTVDVIINHALVSRQNVPPGPFSIGNLPVISGAGEVQLVVRDFLGREVIFTQPFYASRTLLRKDLSSYALEVGFVRENFGLRSNDYGSWMASGTYRRGLSDAMTGEWRAEALPGQAAAGVGGDVLIPHVGTLSTYLVASRGKGKRGSLALLGIERQSPSWSFGAQTQWTSSGFSQVGSLPDVPNPVQSSSFNLSYAAGALGSVSVAYIVRRNREQADTRLATLSYSISLGQLGSVSVTALRSLAGSADTTVFAMLSMPLQATTNFSVSVQSVRSGRDDERRPLVTTTLQRNLPMGEGVGYHLQARSDRSSDVSVSMQNNVGTYTLEAAQGSGDTAQRLLASGGIAFLGGDVFFSRRIDQSFAVARIPDYPNVRVLADNQPAGRTDANGNALIPRLRPYDINTISVDQRDLPLDAKIGSVKVDVVPYFHSGIDVRFPIERSHGATLTVLLEDGKPLPVGATVQVLGKDDTYTVGFEGLVYVAGLGATSRLRASWLNRHCEFDVRFAEAVDPLPDLGNFTCKGLQL